MDTDEGASCSPGSSPTSAVLEIADGGGRRMTIGTRLPLAEIPLGSSIATSGICFSAVDKGADWFTVEASGATLEVTTAGAWRGRRHGQPRALAADRRRDGRPHRVRPRRRGGRDPGARAGRGIAPPRGRVPASLAPLIAVKGSIAVDGISLTVNEAGADRFALNVIPHTWRATNLAERRSGDRVNVEVDMLARYVARQLAFRREPERGGQPCRSPSTSARSRRSSRSRRAARCSS